LEILTPGDGKNDGELFNKCPHICCKHDLEAVSTEEYIFTNLGASRTFMVTA